MSEQETTSVRTGRVLDARALKALAHPLRFRLLERLLEGGPATASGLGREVGESSGATSYHLRQLAEHGLIEEAVDLGSGRDRWWRVVPGGWTLEGFDLLQRPDTHDDAATVLDEVRRARLGRLAHWHADAPRWGKEWAEASIETTARLVLTREEMVHLRDELLEVLDRWRDQVGHRRDARQRSPDTAMVNLDVDIYPIGEPPDAGRSART